MSVMSTMCVLVGAVCVHGFVPTLPASRYNAATSQVVMGATADANLAKKSGIVDTVKGKIEDTSLLFGMPTDGLTVNNINSLRQSLPEDVMMRSVKNSLMKRALGDTDFAVVEPLLEKSNYWFFVGETDMRDTVETVSKFIKENKKEETNPILGGVFDGQLMDTKGVTAVSKLPTKKELIETIAIRIKAVPLKLAKSIKQVPTKTARAINLATVDKMQED